MRRQRREDSRVQAPARGLGAARGACAPLGKQMPALAAPLQHRRGEVDFFEFSSPHGEQDDPRCAGSGGRRPGCRRLLGASGQPGAACAPLCRQMPALAAPVQHRRGELDFFEFLTAIKLTTIIAWLDNTDTLWSMGKTYPRSGQCSNIPIPRVPRNRRPALVRAPHSDKELEHNRPQQVSCGHFH